jgi:NADH:ubiquinone oxidoreductase subunit 2 (subunit N)
VLIWCLLEIRSIRIIIIIINNKIIKNENPIKYFLIQRVASTAFIFRFLIIKTPIKNIFIIPIRITIIIIAIIIKMGITPFH